MSFPEDPSALMRAALAGNDDAYRRLLLHVAAWLRRVVGRGLAAAGRPHADGEDIVQETLLAMHLKRETWDTTQPLEPWLRAIARHKLVDHLRRRGFTDHVDIDDHAGTLAAPGGGEEGASTDAQQMLAALPERQRTIVEAISIEGRSAREVGAALGLSEGAVRVTLHRALKALARVYRGEKA
ncbi:RNA polymerase sigma-70 factor, ECF subfamily [Enhydrobacter aerosaccus]|uniref:RNA polymerase sigma-70 factor, ECF subfamily n=1 Tax=Enhydrobacter aerosaccus TaxID=225324 RepID=A0A1T4TG97_9HYPH|nr:sigma-70 family RNA polymerase sigma factor [Enhydrobacter aerosaccus]SKA39460.1 RNA polymerase sigma-70 factor, ECF subfamily [Enhydrobacter aerosaccus]